MGDHGRSSEIMGDHANPGTSRTVKEQTTRAAICDARRCSEVHQCGRVCGSDSRRDPSLLGLEEVRVNLDVLGPLRRKVFLRIDGMDRAFIDAQSAIDAGVRINEQLACFTEIALVLAGVDAIHWADLDTGGVLRSDAGFSDDVCHRFFPKPPYAARVRILARQRPTGMTEPEVPKRVEFGANLQGKSGG